jgi:hypothetical protein
LELGLFFALSVDAHRVRIQGKMGAEDAALEVKISRFGP